MSRASHPPRPEITARHRALGQAPFFLWTAGYLVTQTFPMMDAKDSWRVRDLHHAFPFKVSAVFCAVPVGLVAWFVPGAKGRSLEEIAQAWNR